MVKMTKPSKADQDANEIINVLKQFAPYLDGTKKTYSFEEAVEIRKKRGLDV
jgi:hypothetical protein